MLLRRASFTYVISGKQWRIWLGRGGRNPPEAEKMVEKWCYFPELYKMTDFLENGSKNVIKVKFPLRFSYVNSKIFSKT